MQNLGVLDVLARALFMYVECKAVGDSGSVVGFKWLQLETFVVFIHVSSSSNYQQW
jgi:hypothetical protein